MVWGTYLPPQRWDFANFLKLVPEYPVEFGGVGQILFGQCPNVGPNNHYGCSLRQFDAMRKQIGISFLWPSTYIIESTSKTLFFFSLTPSPTCKGPDKGCCSSSSPKMLAVQFFSFCLILSGHRQRRLRNLTHSTNKKLFVNIPLLQGFGHLRRVTVIFFWCNFPPVTNDLCCSLPTL